MRGVRVSAQRFDRFEIVFLTHYDALVRYAHRRLPTPAVDDAVADAFLAAWRLRDHLPGRDEDVLPWLYALMRMRVLNARRAAARHPSETLPDEIGSSPDVAEGVVANRLLLRAIAALREDDREILLLAGWEELDISGIARVMNCSRSAAGVRLHRARRRLRAQLMILGVVGDHAPSCAVEDRPSPGPVPFLPALGGSDVRN